MPDLIFTASTADLTRLTNAICGLNNYQDTISGQPNPQTKAQFARAWVIRQWRQMIVQYERQLAIKAAVDAVPSPAAPPIT